jgi:hypothetical protein
MDNNSLSLGKLRRVYFPERNRASPDNVPGAVFGRLAHIDQCRASFLKPLAQSGRIDGFH